jgi:molybdopterin-guanine dinucleotide biosynthesis protein A
MPGLSGAVLLGGASTRMGGDKAARMLGGVPNATRIARLLGSLCDEVLLVGGQPPPDAPGRVVADPEGPRSALRGFVGALEAARGERVLIVATDLPLLTTTLLRALATPTAADAVVPRRDGLPQPLCAVYRRAPMLAKARAHLAGGRLALRALLDGPGVLWLEGEALRAVDPAGTALLNVNTPADHARAEAILQSAASCGPSGAGPE